MASKKNLYLYAPTLFIGLCGCTPVQVAPQQPPGPLEQALIALKENDCQTLSRYLRIAIRRDLPSQQLKNFLSPSSKARYCLYKGTKDKLAKANTQSALDKQAKVVEYLKRHELFDYNYQTLLNTALTEANTRINPPKIVIKPPSPPEKKLSPEPSPPGWQAKCSTDRISAIKTCMVYTFGRSLDGNGRPYGGYNHSFKVTYFNRKGPFILTPHDSPGDRPILRVDNRKPVTLVDNGTDWLRGNDARAIPGLKAGNEAALRYYVFPNNSYDVLIDLTGFTAAWNELQRIK